MVPHQQAQQLQPSSPPSYIVVEGPIGVGKTSLAKRLATTFNYETLLEGAEDNPFLPRFYKNPRQAALSVQLHFLLQRAQQLQDLRQDDLFHPVRVADFLLEKDRLFARLNLDDAEYQLYEQVYQHLTIDAPTPDLVIYLQASVDTLQARIRQRGIPFEQDISEHYLEKINAAYAELFHYYTDAPVLIVNAEHINLVDNDSDYHLLVEQILQTRHGRQFFNPCRIG